MLKAQLSTGVPFPPRSLCCALLHPASYMEANSRKTDHDIDNSVIWVYLVRNNWPTDITPPPPVFTALTVPNAAKLSQAALEQNRSNKLLCFGVFFW